MKKLKFLHHNSQGSNNFFFFFCFFFFFFFFFFSFFFFFFFFCFFFFFFFFCFFFFFFFFFCFFFFFFFFFLKNELCMLYKIVQGTQKWHWSFSRPSGRSKQSKCCFWINNSRTAWPTLILMLFLSSLDNLLQDAHIIFHKDVGNFEIEHKTC